MLGGVLLSSWSVVARGAVAEGADAAAKIPIQRPAGMTAAPSEPVRPAPTSTVTSPTSTPSSSPTPSPAIAPATAEPAPLGPAAGPEQPSPAPVSAAAVAEPSPLPDAHGTLAEEAEAPRPELPHRGAVADFRVGTLGCIGAFCRASGHDVTPGVRLGGFIGGNVRGWFEAGIGGGWGTMTPHITPGTNALLLYGFDPNLLQQALLAQAAGLLSVDLAGLAVTDAKIRSAQAGPAVRVHFIPRGRIQAFVGSGVGYNLLRARYQTAAGEVGLDFHGVAVPVEANLSVYLLRNLAVGVQFDYMWTWQGAAVLDHPLQRLALPVSVLQAAGEQQGIDFRGQMPQMWSVGLALRGRL